MESLVYIFVATVIIHILLNYFPDFWRQRNFVSIPALSLFL